MERFDGRVAVVTGAASGIGLALCERLASEGCRVVLADVEPAPLAQAEAELRQTGADAISVVTDVATAESVDELARRAVEAYGAVHLLCNNAGVTWRSPLVDTTLGDWTWVLGVNLWGVIHGLRSFLPVLVEQDEAHVVNTASITALVPGPYSAVYAASKAAVVAISEVLYKEMAMAGTSVGVSVVCPAGVHTNIATSARNRPDALADSEAPDLAALFAQLAQTNPRVLEVMQSVIEPEQLADEVVDAIGSRRFWVLPHAELNPDISARTEDMVEGRAPRPGPQG